MSSGKILTWQKSTDYSTSKIVLKCSSFPFYFKYFQLNKKAREKSSTLYLYDTDWIANQAPDTSSEDAICTDVFHKTCFSLSFPDRTLSSLMKCCG